MEKWKQAEASLIERSGKISQSQPISTGERCGEILRAAECHFANRFVSLCLDFDTEANSLRCWLPNVEVHEVRRILAGSGTPCEYGIEELFGRRDMLLSVLSDHIASDRGARSRIEECRKISSEAFKAGMNLASLDVHGHGPSATLPYPDVTDYSADLVRQKVAEGQQILRGAGQGDLFASELASYALLALVLLRPWWNWRRGTVQMLSLPEIYEYLQRYYDVTFSVREKGLIQGLILRRFVDDDIAISQDGFYMISQRGLTLATVFGNYAF
ncbi:hypothetical protein ACWGQL_15850 [Streptomyces lydicus]